MTGQGVSRSVKVAEEPMRTRLLFLPVLVAAASITKIMTAPLVMQLVDEGVLRLEDPVDRWLDRHEQVLPTITIRQLLANAGR